jgi:phosphatidylinositol alpha-1,6-mannosyltransferase
MGAGETDGAGSIEGPRTLIVTNDFPPRKGGVERFVFDLADHLPLGTVRVIAPSHPGDAAFDRGLSFPVRRVARPRFRPTGELRRAIDAELLEHRPDVAVFGHALPQVGLASRQVRDAGVPSVMLTHGVEYWFARLPGFRALLRRSTSAASAVTAISEHVARPIRRAVAPTPVMMLSPGVDTERFRPDLDGSAWRERLGVGARPLVLCVGRIVPRKGQDVLVRTFGAVLDAVPGAALVIVGDGPARRTVERLAAQTAPAGSIVFAGEVSDEDLPSLYSAADVFAMPCRSRWGGLEVEGFGIVFMEAASAGLPVVAGRSGGAAEAVVDGDTGLVVDGTDDAAVVEAIVRLLRDPPAASAMGARGRARAVEEYDWHRIAGRLGTILRDVVEGRTPTA